MRRFGLLLLLGRVMVNNMILNWWMLRVISVFDIV